MIDNLVELALGGLPVDSCICLSTPMHDGFSIIFTWMERTAVTNITPHVSVFSSDTPHIRNCQSESDFLITVNPSIGVVSR